MSDDIESVPPSDDREASNVNEQEATSDVDDIDERKSTVDLKAAFVELGDHSAPPDYDAEMGDEAPLPAPDVDISLHPSRESPVAGELWSITGDIHNRSTQPVWIVDRMTNLALAPELWGQARQEGSMGAFFPTIKSRRTAEVVRIDPGASYSVIWKISPMPGEDPDKYSTLARIKYSIKNFAFFNPGVFDIFSTVHVWATKPEFTSGRVSNIGASVPITVRKALDVAPSPWVLILGAIIGGILCYATQLLYGSVPLGTGYMNIAKDIVIGGAAAMILCAVVTILISRLATTDW